MKAQRKKVAATSIFFNLVPKLTYKLTFHFCSHTNNFRLHWSFICYNLQPVIEIMLFTRCESAKDPASNLHTPKKVSTVFEYCTCDTHVCARLMYGTGDSDPRRRPRRMPRPSIGTDEPFTGDEHRTIVSSGDKRPWESRDTVFIFHSTDST